jgi:Cu/Zn superoxide dismutase
MTHRPLLASLAACAIGAGAVAGLADAHHPKALAYAAKLAPVDGSGVAGTARLLDKPGKGRDVLTVAVRGLTPRTAYAFHVHETDEPGNPCLEEHDAGHGHEEHGPIAGWKPSRLKASKKGRAVAIARARGFEKHADETYWVDVETTAGRVVACGVLKLR